MIVKSIVWGGANPPNCDCDYDHCFGESPLGEWMITWESWEYKTKFCIIESPFGCIEGYGATLEDAQKTAQIELEKRILNCIET